MKVHFEHIYEHIGYLFYALAAEHKTLTTTEYTKFRSLVHHQWHAVKGDMRWQANLLHHILSATEAAFQKSLASAEAWNHFKNYYLIHRLPFGIELRKKIMVTGKAIIKNFSVDNQSSDLLKNLESLFELQATSAG